LGQAILVWFGIGILVMRGAKARSASSRQGPAHPSRKKAFLKLMDCRVKPGNDGKRLLALYRVESANCQKGLPASLLAARLYG
jgi:hypothetical protein